MLPVKVVLGTHTTTPTEGYVEIVVRGGTIRVYGRITVESLRAVLRGLAGVIGPPGDTRIWLAAGVTDMRRGMYGLAALVETMLAEHVYGWEVFVFRGRRGDLIKALWADRDGPYGYGERACAASDRHPPRRGVMRVAGR